MKDYAKELKVKYQGCANKINNLEKSFNELNLKVSSDYL